MFSLTELATVAGIAGFIKLLAIPAAKQIFPQMEGRTTVIFAYAAGVVVGVLSAAGAGQVTVAGLATGALTGIIGAASAIGVQAATTAVMRPKES